MEITVTFVVKADVDGWAKAKGCTTNDYAEAEIMDYLANIVPDQLKGQTFLTFDSVVAIES